MYWKNVQYVNQYDSTKSPIKFEDTHSRNSYRKKKTRRYVQRKYRPCNKYIVYSHEDGQLTTAIEFLDNGKVMIGPDVWRLSNPADFCEYKFETFKNMDMAMLQYDFSNNQNKISGKENTINVLSQHYA